MLAPEGSLVLWNSKTFHQGKEPDQGRKLPNHRLVGYVCFTPRAWATEAQLRKKQKAFGELRTTSHWPHRVKLFPKNPRSYGRALPDTAPISPPELSKEGRRLAGFGDEARGGKNVA